MCPNIRGLLAGCKYRVQVCHLGRLADMELKYAVSHGVHLWRADWSAPEDSGQHPARVPMRVSLGEAAMLLSPDADPTTQLRFQIFVYDMWPGLTEEEALIAKRETTVFFAQIKHMFSSLLNKIPPGPDPNTSVRALWNRHSSWTNDELSWTTWLRKSYEQVAHSSFLANTYKDTYEGRGGGSASEGEGGSANTEGCKKIFDIPVSVMNLPESDLGHARQESSRRLLQGIGFLNVTFPAAIAWSEFTVNTFCSRC
jgi:hypothetical protein